MARDKLITIRIEGDKRQAFGDLAKSQNTDTASLLYDFISGCLDGRIDIKLVTGKGNRLGNQIDSDRLDKLETTTQRLDHWIGALSERVNDWILRSDRRVNDCEKGLSDKMISLEHRLNALASQLDSQRIDRIDTDSQRIDDMEPLIKEALRLDHLDDQRLIDAIESRIEDTEIDESDYEDESVTSPLPTGEPSPFPTIGENPDMEPLITVETADDTVETVIETVESVYDNVEAVYEDEPDKGAIGPVPSETDSIEPGKGEGMNPNQAHEYLISKGIEDISYYYLNKWAKDGVIPWRGKTARKYLTLINKLYYPNPD